MARRERGGCAGFVYLGFLLVASSFCHGTRLTKLKALDKTKGNRTLGGGQTRGSELHFGRLLIGQRQVQVAEIKGAKTRVKLQEIDPDYQADRAWPVASGPKGQDGGFSRQKQDNAAVERLLKMEPKVECTRDSMKLQVHDASSTPGSLLFVERGSLSPLPLSKLPASCGYSIHSTQRDLVLVAPYDGCFVALEEDTYVLPLRWYGLPVRMSCPLMKQSSPNPPMVTCHAEGMVVKSDWAMSVAKIKVKLSADWEPLMTASPRCGFSVVSHPEGIAISVRYAPCLEKRDGMYTLELAGEGETTIFCPSLSPAEPEATNSPAKDSNDPTEAPKKGGHPDTSSHNSPSNHVSQSHVDQTHLPYYPPYLHPSPQPATKQESQDPPTEKPSTASKKPQPSHPEGPHGQFNQQFYPYPYPYSHPATRPQQPSQTEAPKGQVHQSEYGKKPDVPKPAQPGAPQGQVYEQMYPFNMRPQPETQTASNPTATEEPLQPESPQGQGQQFFFLRPEPENKPDEKPTEGQLYQQFYPFNFPSFLLPEHGNQQATKPSAKEPAQPESPQGQDQQQNFLQPEPEKKPTAAPKQTDFPQGHVFQHLYPFHYPVYNHPDPSASNPSSETEKPATRPNTLPASQKTETQHSQVHQQFNPQPVPTADPQPQPTGFPHGQFYQQFYPFPYPMHHPPNPSNSNPTSGKEPPQPQAPQGKEQHIVLHPEPENKPDAGRKPAQPDASEGQFYHQFYPFNFPFYPPEPVNQQTKKPAAKEPQQPEKKPTAAPKPQTGSTKGQEAYQQFYNFHYPFYPEKQPATKPTPASKPQKPENLHPDPEKKTDNPIAAKNHTKGQGHQQFLQPELEEPTVTPEPQQFYPLQYPFPYPFYNPHQSTSNPSSAKEPPQPEVPKGQQQVFLQPEPQHNPEEPTATQKPALPETHQGQYYQQYFPFNFPFHPLFGPETQPTKPSVTPTPAKPDDEADEKPSKTQKPAHPGATEGQVFQQFHPYPSPFIQPKPEDSPNAKPTATEEPPHRSQTPQITSAPAASVQRPLNVPPVYCPQSCPPGISNCCLQIAFHQHHHHIVPAQGTPLDYTGLPSIPSMFFSNFDQGVGFAVPSQKPPEATTTKAAATTTKATTSASVQPPSSPSKVGNQQPPDGNPDALKGNDPKELPSPQQPYPYVLPDSLHPYWQSLSHNQRLPSYRPLPAYHTMPFYPHNLNPGVDISQYLPQQQIKPAAKGQHSSDGQSRDSKDQTEVKGKPNHIKVPHNQFQGTQPAASNFGFPAPLNLQSTGVDSKKPTTHNPTEDAIPESRGYVLLQQGPPGRETEEFNRSPVPYMPLFHGQSYKPPHPQDLKPPNGLPQHPRYMPGSDNFHPSQPGPHFVPLPQDPSFSNDNLKPQLPEFWKPMSPLSSNARIPTHVPKKAFNRRSSAAGHQTAFNRPLHRGGN